MKKLVIKYNGEYVHIGGYIALACCMIGGKPFGLNFDAEDTIGKEDGIKRALGLYGVTSKAYPKQSVDPKPRKDPKIFKAVNKKIGVEKTGNVRIIEDVTGLTTTSIYSLAKKNKPSKKGWLIQQIK